MTLQTDRNTIVNPNAGHPKTAFEGNSTPTTFRYNQNQNNNEMVVTPAPEIKEDNFKSPRGDLDIKNNTISGRVSLNKMAEICQIERRGGATDHTNSHRELLKIKLDHKNTENVPRELQEFNNQDLNPPPVEEKPGNL